jgi:glycosidase
LRAKVVPGKNLSFSSRRPSDQKKIACNRIIMSRLTHLLHSIYPANRAAAVQIELEQLCQSVPGQKNTAPELSEQDALLITYADQVREPGRAPLATLADFTRAHLADVVSGVHLLPFYPWSSDDGFSVKDFFAVDPASGDWPDIERFRPDFDLMFDAVFNHMSAQSEWFQKFVADEPAFRDFFVTVTGNPDLSQVVRPRALPLLTEFSTARGPEKVWTTFSADQVDLNFKNPAVLLATLRALLFYVHHGAKFIRLDAIAYLWKEIGTNCIHLPQTHQVIQLMRAVLDDVAPGVRLITETNVPHADNISYFGDGTNEAQLVYNFALPPLVLHSLATSNAEKLTRWAASLELPSPQTTFFNFLASHDGIGMNPARGILSQAEIDALVKRATDHGGFVSYKHNSDGSKSPYELNITYFDALSNPAAGEPEEIQIKRFLVAHAIMFALSGVPGIYFHSLFGSRNDRAGAESSGIPRRINRQKLSRAELEAELARPDSLRTRVFTGLRNLLQQRRQNPAFAPGATQRLLEMDSRVFALERISAAGKDRVLCLKNVANAPVSVGPNAELKSAIILAPYETRWIT